MADAPALLEIYTPYVESTPISFETEVPSLMEFTCRISSVLLQNPWIVASSSERIVGYAYASEHRSRKAYRWSVDVAVYVRSGFQRKGLGRALYSRLFSILKAQRYVNAYAGITLPNEQSVGLHEQFGFHQVGVYQNAGYKMGSWHDVGWWQLQLNPPEADPKDPLPWALVESQKLWEN